MCSLASPANGKYRTPSCAREGAVANGYPFMSKKDPPGYPGDEAITKAFGEALRKLRLERGLSVEEADAIRRAGIESPRLPRALGIVVRRLREQQKMSRTQLSAASG